MMNNAGNFRAICCSHSPAMYVDIDPIEPEDHACFFGAMKQEAEALEEFKPDLLVIFHPDHFQGQFVDNMPAFCISAKAKSVWEVNIEPQVLNIPSDLAVELAAHLIASRFDVALARNGVVDHGVTVPLKLLGDTLQRYPVLPIFVNCAATPLPTFSRVRELGEEIGRFFGGRSLRVAFIGSGGLSHQAPANETVRLQPELLFRECKKTKEQQIAYEGRAKDYIKKMIAGGPDAAMKPNAEWDQEFLRSIVEFDQTKLDALQGQHIEKVAGGGAHEVRAWIGAIAAARAAGVDRVKVKFYRPIVEWVTGMGVVSSQI